MHIEYEKYIRMKCGYSELDYMGRNNRFYEYINKYDTHIKVLKNSFGYTKEPIKNIKSVFKGNVVIVK